MMNEVKSRKAGKNNLLFDFSVNKENKTIVVKKEFAANSQLVWDAWTKSELLDKWWAPLPYRNETISMNFIAGGAWHYAMVSPQGDKHFCKAYYQRIDALKMFSYKDAFCNDQGEDLTEMPSMNWANTFTSNNGVTTVNVVLNFETVDQLENIIKMGFKEGFTMGLSQLENLLQQ